MLEAFDMRFSAHWFTLGFCFSYAAILVFELGVITYYPITGHWHIGAPLYNEGPVMHWYGLVILALIVGGVVAVVLKEQWLPRLLRQHNVFIVWVLMLATGWLLRGFWLGA